MEKVKLTKVQTKAIEDIKGTMHLNLEANLREQIEKGWYGYPFGSLNKLTTKEFLDALYIGYEVEETFEVGDWVTEIREGGKTYKVTKVHKDWGTGAEYVRNENTGELQLFRHIRHATPEEIAEEKQRRWWAKHGREVWELQEGDLLERLYDKTIIEFSRFDQGALEYRIQSSYYREDILGYSKRYKVICFAEDRKDVK